MAEMVIINSTDSMGRHVMMFTANSTSVFSAAHNTPIHFRGYRFKSLDQYYYGRMALYFKSYDIFKAIMVSTGDRCATLAQEIPNYDTDEWHQRSEEIMHNGIREKFRQNSLARERLLRTGTARLVHINANDARWGNGLNEEESVAVSPDAHPGANMLGKLYMQVRNELSNA